MLSTRHYQEDNHSLLIEKHLKLTSKMTNNSPFFKFFHAFSVKFSPEFGNKNE